MINSLFTNPLFFFISFIALTVSLTVHEFSHAWMADYLGDPTARLQGRLTLNPLAHFDPMGLAFILLIGFGWGKPVNFDPYNLKNPRKDAGLISLAGPLSNLITAIFCSILIRLITLVPVSTLSTIGYQLLSVVLYWNIVIGVFNLLPVHPLDGFKIFGGFLSEKKAHEWYQLQRYGYLFLFLLIIPIGGSSLLTFIISPVVSLLNGILLPAV